MSWCFISLASKVEEGFPTSVRSFVPFMPFRTRRADASPRIDLYFFIPDLGKYGFLTG